MIKMIPDGSPSERARSFAGHSVKATPDGQQYWQVDHSQYGAVTEVPMSKMALVSAGNLQASIQLIPSVTHGDKASVDLLEQFRKGLKGEMQARGVKLSVLAFLVKALAKALQEMPKFNTSLSADGQTLIQKHYVHIGIAVDTDYGLVVPVIRNADQKGIVAIAEEINVLALAAKSKRLKAEQMGGASMSITSLGNIGGTYLPPSSIRPKLPSWVLRPWSRNRSGTALSFCRNCVYHWISVTTIGLLTEQMRLGSHVKFVSI